MPDDEPAPMPYVGQLIRYNHANSHFRFGEVIQVRELEFDIQPTDRRRKLVRVPIAAFASCTPDNVSRPGLAFDATAYHQITSGLYLAEYAKGDER